MKIIKQTFPFLVALQFVISCSKMNDMHQIYLDEGEVIYASKLDSVAPNSGYDRIELELYALSQKINKVRIYWNDKNDSLDVAINNQVGIYKQIITNLPESEYLFTLVSFDEFGNNSLEYEVVAQSYGSNYIYTLANRSIESVSIDGNNIVIVWRPVHGSTVVSTVFTYQNSNNDISEIIVLPTDMTITISDAKIGGEYRFKTLYKPEPNAIDIFETEIEPGIFPALRL